MKTNCADISSEESRKVDFIKEVENVLQGLEAGKVAITDVYDQLVKLMGDQEMGRVLQLMHQRAMTILKEKN